MRFKDAYVHSNENVLRIDRIDQHRIGRSVGQVAADISPTRTGIVCTPDVAHTESHPCRNGSKTRRIIVVYRNSADLVGPGQRIERTIIKTAGAAFGGSA